MPDDLPLFKYMTRATARIVLQNGTLRWSTPGTLNDPYDIQFDIHLGLDREAVKAVALRKLWDAHYGDQPVAIPNRLGRLIEAVREVFPRLPQEEFNREYGEAFDEGLEALARALPEIQGEVRRVMANTKILCMSEASDSIVMWAHYAEQQQGVVLCFQSVNGLDSPWRVARPVDYVEDMPLLIDDVFMANMLSEPIDANCRLVFDRMIYTKAAVWSYERERRLSSGAGRNENEAFEDAHFHPLELTAVILGCRMPQEDRRSFSELTRRLYPHTEILTAELTRDRFQMQIKKA